MDSSDRKTILALDGVSKSYGATPVLHPTDLEVANGEFLTILGPSGSGKTTILRLIAGFIQASRGRILLDDVDIARVPVFERPFNTVFQDYALFPHMNVSRNIGYGLRMSGTSPAEVARRVKEVLAIVELSEKAERYPAEISGGQRQRVALARAIVCEPRIVLLDEPLAALDAELRRSMQHFLKDLQRRIRTTFIFVTHDQEEAISISDRIVVMSHGRIEQIGPPKDIYYRPATLFVAGFFGENNILPASFVATDAGGRLVVDCPLGRHVVEAAASETKTLFVAIRPESLDVRPVGSAALPGLGANAVIDKITFLGATTEILVRLSDGEAQVVRARVKTDGLGDWPSVGCQVRLTWSPSAISVLAR